MAKRLAAMKLVYLDDDVGQPLWSAPIVGEAIQLEMSDVVCEGLYVYKPINIFPHEDTGLVTHHSLLQADLTSNPLLSCHARATAPINTAPRVCTLILINLHPTPTTPWPKRIQIRASRALISNTRRPNLPCSPRQVLRVGRILHRATTMLGRARLIRLNSCIISSTMRPRGTMPALGPRIATTMVEIQCNHPMSVDLHKILQDKLLVHPR